MKTKSFQRSVAPQTLSEECLCGGNGASGTAPTQAIAQTTPENGTQLTALAVGCIVLLLWLAVILWLVSIFFPTASKSLGPLWQWWAIGAGLILLALLTIWLFRRWFPKVAELARTGVVVFIVLPVLLVGFGTIFLIPNLAYRITCLRSTFLIAVCLFPALLYYLFIAARKFSLLNDYFVNLARLGLLEGRSSSTEIECKVR